MWGVRPSLSADIDALVDLAASLGSGMTTFPADHDTIAHKVTSSVASFHGRAAGPEAQYLMVLEDLVSERILGVSAVYPCIGHPYGFFSYHTDRLIQRSDVVDASLDCRVLTLSNAYTGLTEIGTLAVAPDLRRGGAGKILAKARYMLMACFPDLFADRVIAEMRGWQIDEGVSPFWSAVGKKFFHIDFPEADQVSAIHGVRFIADLMPKYPLYVDLLPEEARGAIGKAHATSAIAME